MKVLALVIGMALLGLALVEPAIAQGNDKIARVGFISPGAPNAGGSDALRSSLADLGYVEGKNLVFEARYARGQYDLVSALASELLQQNVDVIAVIGAVIVRAAKAAVQDKPLVFTIVVDPVSENVVSDVKHPGGNITGVTNFDPLQASKRLALLKEVVPNLARVGILGDRGVSDAQLRSAEAAALSMAIKPSGFRIDGAAPDLDQVFAAMATEGVNAILILEEPALSVHRKRIADLARQFRLPTMFPPLSADSGGLVFYGTNLTSPIRKMAAQVDEILRGTKPGDIPVETVIAYDLVVNLKTARELGIAIPHSVIARATKVIE